MNDIATYFIEGLEAVLAGAFKSENTQKSPETKGQIKSHGKFPQNLTKKSSKKIPKTGRGPNPISSIQACK